MKRRATGRDDHERVRGHHIRPLRRHRRQLTGAIDEVDPIMAPAPAPLDELELQARQRMKRMRHLHLRRITQILTITCTRRLDPTAASKATTARSASSATAPSASLRRPPDRPRVPLLRRRHHRAPAMNFTPNSDEAPKVMSSVPAWNASTSLTTARWACRQLEEPSAGNDWRKQPFYRA